MYKITVPVTNLLQSKDVENNFEKKLLFAENSETCEHKFQVSFSQILLFFAKVYSQSVKNITFLYFFGNSYSFLQNCFLGWFSVFLALADKKLFLYLSFYFLKLKTGKSKKNYQKFQSNAQLYILFSVRVFFL